MIDKMDEPTSEISEQQLTRIQIFTFGNYFKMGAVKDPV